MTGKSREIWMVSDFGTKLRAKRQHQKMTLKQLAEKTGLSISLLSEIERGLAQPSMSSLRRIVRAMDLSMFNFVEEQTDQDWSRGKLELQSKRPGTRDDYIKDIRVVRSGKRKKLMYPNFPALFELLTPDLNRKIEILYGKFEPGFSSGPEPIKDPPGEKCAIILEGCLEMRIEEKTVLLEQGDAVYYPGDSQVSLRVIGDKACHSILVVTPPTF
jgi:transcriptional regulator with XRE-family HTH domain